MVILFDFDRAYHHELGANNINDQYFEQVHGIKNEYTLFTDFQYLFMCICTVCGSPKLLEQMCTSDTLFEHVKQYYDLFQDGANVSYFVPNLIKYYGSFDTLLNLAQKQL